jgi:integrase
VVRNLVPTLHAKQAPEIRLLAGEQSKDYRPTAKDTATYLQHAAKRFPDLHDAAVLGFEAGPRLKELRSLKIEDVHLQAVGSKTGYVYFRAADADPSNRAVPLTDAARRMLARRLAELAKRIGNHKTKWLFPSPRNGARPIAHKTIEDKHLTVRKELDLDPRFTCHTWRHEFCSRLGDSGAQAPVIMMLAGHRSLATSQKYVHITAGRAEDAILKMNTKLMATVGANTPYNFNYGKKSDNVSVMS